MFVRCSASGVLTFVECSATTTGHPSEAAASRPHREALNSTQTHTSASKSLRASAEYLARREHPSAESGGAPRSALDRSTPRSVAACLFTMRSTSCPNSAAPTPPPASGARPRHGRGRNVESDPQDHQRPCRVRITSWSTSSTRGSASRATSTSARSSRAERSCDRTPGEARAATVLARRGCRRRVRLPVHATRFAASAIEGHAAT